MIDIEPLTNSHNENIVWESERKRIEDRKDEDEHRYQFIRGASGRSTFDGSGISGSLDVHFHTETAPSPIFTGPSEINETKKHESVLQKSYLETDLPVYDLEIDAFNPPKAGAREINGGSKYLGETTGQCEDNLKGPPQVWISKSLSMEQGINKLED